MLFRSLVPAALAALSLTSVAHAQFVAIQGVQDGLGPGGARPARLEISKLQQDPYAWGLYIQALVAFQAMPESALTGYFQVAGIHGRPYSAWDDVNGQNTDTGYCTHDSILFPSWHRPYLALIEDQISAQAKLIASQYKPPVQTSYVAAAKTLRLPYWDWAASSAIPAIVSQPQVSVFTPTGLKTFDNPLYRYKFPPLDPNGFPTNAGDGFLATTPYTIRDPNANAALASGGLTQAVYQLFSITDYPTFATQAVSGSSLESVHGAVHVYVGGRSGHMTYLSYSAFDPIFWLHHCQVDRLWALWQATHPDAYFPAGGLQDPYGTFTINAGSQDLSSTGLTPFTSDAKGDMWNSDTARSLATWGYTYPEINDWNQTKAQLSQSVTAQVNALYGPKPVNGVASRKHTRDVTPAKGTEWFVNIAVDKFNLASSFVILIFLGDVPADSTTWVVASIGAVLVSTPPYKRPNAHVITHGEIALKDGLAERGISASDVQDYLTKNLQWKVQMADGSVVDTKTCNSLKITVSSKDVTYPSTPYGFPTYGNPTDHPDITQGKAGSSY